MRGIRSVLACVLVLSMLCTMTACAVQKKEEADSVPPHDTLMVGYNAFSGIFSPFFSETSSDGDVCKMTSVPLLASDREGNIVLNGIAGQTRAYNGSDYSYSGIADCAIQKNEDGTVTYSFRLREDVQFSDGQTLNADDVIFSMYVLSDPVYDGDNTFSSLPIMGMEEYRAGMLLLTDMIRSVGEDNADFT